MATKRSVHIGLACWTSFVVCAAQVYGQQLTTQPALPDKNQFVGLWSVTSAQTTFSIDVRGNRTCLIIYTHKGSSQITRAQWCPMPGGILIDALPRFRFWQGRSAMEVRAEMETLHPDMTSRDIREFPKSFFMRRSPARLNLPAALAQRPLSESWKVASLPAQWDDSAGRR